MPCWPGSLVESRSTIGGAGHYLLYSRRFRHEWACNNNTDGYPGMSTGQTLSNAAESTVWGKYLSSLISRSTPHCYPSRYTIYNPQTPLDIVYHSNFHPSPIVFRYIAFQSSRSSLLSLPFPPATDVTKSWYLNTSPLLPATIVFPNARLPLNPPMILSTSLAVNISSPASGAV